MGPWLTVIAAMATWDITTWIGVATAGGTIGAVVVALVVSWMSGRKAEAIAKADRDAAAREAAADRAESRRVAIVLHDLDLLLSIAETAVESGDVGLLRARLSALPRTKLPYLRQYLGDNSSLLFAGVGYEHELRLEPGCGHEAAPLALIGAEIAREIIETRSALVPQPPRRHGKATEPLTGQDPRSPAH